MNIGNIRLDGKLVLAPMAGVTDIAFRHICRTLGAALTTTEMVSAKALCYNDKKTAELLRTLPEDRPLAVQIFGHEPKTMAEAAQKAIALSGARISAQPSSFPAIFPTGQPMLMSRISAPESAIAFCAASAIVSGSWPKIWTARGRSSGRLRRRSAVFLSL